MKITYIKHSGFLIEWETSVWMFDYEKGEIPETDRNKDYYIFVSHSHGDHYNPDIFRLFGDHPRVTYILSEDIRYKVKKLNLSVSQMEKIRFTKPYQTLNLKQRDQGELRIRTLRSTDQGVAFLVDYETEKKNRRIYHAGDLNWWVWKEESKQEYGNMTAKFKKEMDLLQAMTEEKKIDAAFIPLDPRQEEWQNLGMDYFREHIGADHIFPMHFWEQYGVIDKYREKISDEKEREKIQRINAPGFMIEID